MPLQIRRGTNAERLILASPLVSGELLWIVDDQRLYIGDGTTLARDLVPVTGFNAEDAQDTAASLFTAGSHTGITFVYEDANDRVNATVNIPQLLQNLDLNNFSITGTGNIAITGDLSITGNITGDYKGSLFADDSTILVDALNGSINLDGTVKGDIIPDQNEAYDLGSSSNRFKDLYLSGTSLYLGSAQITASGAAVNLPAGSTINGVLISDIESGVAAGSDYNINIVGDDSSSIINSSSRTVTASGGFFGNLTGDVDGIVTGFAGSSLVGNVTGDVKGSIFGDDSTKIVDAVANEVYAAGGFFGNLTGDVVGNVTGNITTNLISSSDSSTIVCDTPFEFQTNVAIDGTLEIGDGAVLRTNDPGNLIDMAGFFDSDLPVALRLRKSRGSSLSPAALQTDDRIGSVLFNAFDGSNYINAASIQARVTGTVSSGIVPTSLRFFINNTAGNEVESLRIDETGSVRSFSTLFCIASDGQNNSTPVNISNHHNTSSNACNLVLSRTRGTNQSPTAVQNNDPIFDLVWSGHDGSSLIGSSFIRTVVDGAVSTGIVPGRIDIYTQDTIGGYATRMQINSAKITMNAMPVLPTYADETAADASIGGAGNRVNGMMYYDTAVGAVRAVVAGAWASL